ncbi:MAG: aminomethyl-transferring glycine dehydrogenase subunit GcvPA [Eubacteriales bacterium]|uniref:aminomethyl-transferring glycine dehydrogenase subunit GcvPA n=1 Tax=Fenollaria sp. TaxID=1965292 RepID=UPI002A7636B3|nr:aminomethyl-transferring glycine dehydrogenase subunit GcvPA [Fenollaria sp.]MDD7340144.1 aminomethyl-transferring glycine dehydrogenase subunit GcvPA [Eubacteriales bacterium]MDY3105568.1 aminomethyl-transferring glycine dehydrogenase subunit GcvPA [Fenollaria sp.]
MYPYLSQTPENIKEMLDKIGVKSEEDLFDCIPKSVRFKGELNLPKHKSELEVRKIMNNLADMNCSTDKKVCFLGAGAYDHYIPSVIGAIASRSEYYTSYTPYQPEVSQGTLQMIFEFQTMMSNLVGLPITNASLYDNSNGVVESALMCCNTTRKKQVIVSKALSPSARMVLDTYTHSHNIEVVEVEIKDGATDLDDLKNKLSDDAACVIMQSPNFFGVIEDMKAACDLTHELKKTYFIADVDTNSLGILQRPGDYGADIVVGEAQPFGIPLSYGGPYLGFISSTDKFMRKLPGRIAGQTVDKDGNRSWVLTLTAREQHIRRDKATSNICSNQGLNVLCATIYMALMGKKGLREVSEQCAKKAHYLQKEICKSGKYKLLFDKPFYKEFVITSDISIDKINEALNANGFMNAFNLTWFYGDEYKNTFMLAVTEKRTKEEMDKLVEVLEGIEC